LTRRADVDSDVNRWDRATVWECGQPGHAPISEPPSTEPNRGRWSCRLGPHRRPTTTFLRTRCSTKRLDDAGSSEVAGWHVGHQLPDGSVTVGVLVKAPVGPKTSVKAEALGQAGFEIAATQCPGRFTPPPRLSGRITGAGCSTQTG
jgi:hypothetical protein